MTTATKSITIAHSPDSDDAFMFFGLGSGGVPQAGPQVHIEVHQVLKDIQSLNEDAKAGRYEVSAISFAVYPDVAHLYALMPCGASMGDNYGPMIVTREAVSIDQVKKMTIAIPGLQTTAYLALRLALGADLNVRVVPFDQILEEVRDGKADAGLIIHEGQLTYSEMGLHKILDLGEWWYELTGGLPLPLGGNVVRKDLGAEMMKQATRMLQASIRYSLDHRQEALAYAMSYARGLETKQADKFVGMYVNELTVDYGEKGRTALRKLFDMAYENGIFKKPVEVEFVNI